MTSWNETIHFCHWYGVSCGRRHQRVTRLDLRSSKLSGSISPHVGNLTANNLYGSIPDIFGQMTNLTFLSFDANDLSGTIPPSIFNLSSITTFAVSVNKIQGTLPSNLGIAFPSLEHFSVGKNQFSGPIPVSISNASNLYHLGMEGNKLHGKVPSLENLQMVAIHFNNFGGALPQCIANLSSSILQIGMSENKLVGSIPNGFGNLVKLETLWLSGNRLSGHIPPDVGKLHNFGVMSPEVIGRLSSSLSVLDLSENHLTGFLPKEIGHFPNLEAFDISNNICIQLEFLDMEGNFIQGDIPSSLGSLRGLIGLYLSHNNLSGMIPEFLERFEFMQSLDLSYNNFEGMLPMKGIFKGRIESNRQMGNLSYFWSSWNHVCHHVLDHTSSDSEEFLRLSYRSLLNATNGFSISNLIGMGSFGSVYKGVLEQGETVAIKVINLVHRGASKSFIAECEALRNIRHRNLMKVLSVCSGIDYRRKRPTDEMFQGTLNLHNFVKAASPEQMVEIVDPFLAHEGVEESLIAILAIGVACSAENKLQENSIGE
ncbi:LRR receptor-like serine/threonine-protein kinase [Pyrus ussuriensis x Pyrus communis]|uniref:LRR receptor-like serine/threonine-protein kinase n=1 Tax=Pyrus ussuriensis x Pyrus communis TaxID=2448454 RepID=A0A5N5HN16_9ROSA|nr:LRR receptor-like serine/threonine-protein kinase [Pyrus ussuriensis x Pyrus communis]